MTVRLGEEGGFSLIEMLTVMAILTTVLGGVVALFVSGINADADQNRRFQAGQDARVSLDRMRRDLHGGCTISAPASYNTALSSVTIYFSSDACLSGTHSITWCTSGSAGRYALYRLVATSCASPTAKYADYLTSGTIFTYLPPNSHLVTSSSLNMGTSSSYIATQDGSSSLPRLHVDLTTQLKSGLVDKYRLVDDIALRNGPRSCASGVASC